ncbi:MAG: 50S ribosomal protein L17 [Planctomycetaceae bacterium]|nr:50S ribosomal protein L17 [Planctomycetaceae bacterium]
MRHRKRGRVLGRSPSHRAAMLKNLASALILTERNAEDDPNAPKLKGRIVTTLHKAKEVRPLVEKCITMGGKAIAHAEEAKKFGTHAQRKTQAWKDWRESPKWRDWAVAMAPAVAIRRRLLVLLGDKQAVEVLLDTVAPRFRDRKGGYTRVVRLATPRLGDAGTRAIIEFVGVRDRKVQKSEKPAFSDDAAEPVKA